MAEDALRDALAEALKRMDGARHAGHDIPLLETRDLREVLDRHDATDEVAVDRGTVLLAVGMLLMAADIARTVNRDMVRAVAFSLAEHAGADMKALERFAGPRPDG